MAENAPVLDDGTGKKKKPNATSTAPYRRRSKRVSGCKTGQKNFMDRTQKAVSSAEEHNGVPQSENEKLFCEFVDRCSAVTTDCPEVLTFLQTKYAKASPDFLSSVEFRNSLQRCVTAAQRKRSKMFALINQLCKLLKIHATKKRQLRPVVQPVVSAPGSQPPQPPSDTGLSKEQTTQEVKESSTTLDQRLTSKPEEHDDEKPREDGKNPRRGAAENQIAYLENLLKVYHEEICLLQQTELSLDDMEAEDSLYIQEHKLKRKLMKVFEKLCELKGCSTLTGRVIEQRIPYSSTPHGWINSRIEEFINAPEVQRNPPDYQDVLQQVLKANQLQKQRLCRKQLNQIALDAFRETGSRLQERRHLDLVFNFGSQLTDLYSPASDPALLDPVLFQKLRSNRELALRRLEEVVTEYAIKQDQAVEQKKRKDEEEMPRSRRDTDTEQEEDDEDEEEFSSDPDIEEEIRTSTRQNGPENDVEGETVKVGVDRDHRTADGPAYNPAPVVQSHRERLSQSKSTQTDDQKVELNCSFSHVLTMDDAAVSSALFDGPPHRDPPTSTSSSASARSGWKRKRKKEEETSGDPAGTKHFYLNNSCREGSGVVHGLRGLRGRRPQHQLTVQLTRLVVKDNQPQNAHTSVTSDLKWAQANRTWDYKEVCELLVHGPSRLVLVRDLLRRGFFIENMPDDWDVGDVKCDGTAVSPTAPPPPPPPPPPPGPPAVDISPTAPNRTTKRLSRHQSTVRLQIKKAGLNQKFPCTDGLLLDFRKYLQNKVTGPHSRLQVDQVSSFLRFLQPSGKKPTLDFLATPEKSPAFLSRLLCVSSCTATVVSYVRNMLTFLDYLSTRVDLEKNRPGFQTQITAYRETLLDAQRIYQSQTSPGVTDHQQVLEAVRKDFLCILDKVKHNRTLTGRERTMYHNYCVAVLVLTHSLQPAQVEDLTVTDWLNRTTADDKVIIGANHHGPETAPRGGLVVTREEEDWLLGYYRYIRPQHVGSSSSNKFFVSCFGKAQNVGSVICRLQENRRGRKPAALTAAGAEDVEPDRSDSSAGTDRQRRSLRSCSGSGDVRTVLRSRNSATS